ncbi:O-antigen ligase family protein [Arthrobacter sp. ISL-72]|uniref:O-antigen ligase family protein n=1 Tax=Arthrobacter sp. ISL-72 TaxID=2819114 RepID=UPI001BE545AE|nr:O-antigen ligase family protein [Arthrobacter sp. ISL-72]MBT2596625.1 O-antigen ligase family protein [Arthrobacter sp. ISL-72]
MLVIGITTLMVFRPMQAALAVAGLIFAFVVARLGIDAPLVWLLIGPWQFVPGVDANILLNPFLWVALIRLLVARRTNPHRPKRLGLSIVAILPISYLVEWLFFGVAEPSLLLWMLPYIPLALSLALVPPNPAVLQRHLFYVGIATALFVVVEASLGWSLNSLMQSNISVQEYLRSGRALGPTGNPLFTSSILMVAFFLPPRPAFWMRISQGIILVATILTGSKSAVIGLAVGVLVLAISKGVKRFAITSVGVLAGLLAVQVAADSTFSNIFQRFAVFSDLRTSDPDRAFTTDFVFDWLQKHPLGGTPIGAALIDKRLLSPVSGGSRFGIESTWLAMAADTGIVFIGLCLFLMLVYVLRHRADAKAQALFGFAVSLFFWNGLFGAWLIGPMMLILLLTPPADPMADQRKSMED